VLRVQIGETKTWPFQKWQMLQLA